jgi:hypothetical protein
VVKPVNIFIKFLPFLIASILIISCKKEKVLPPEVTTASTSEITQISAISGGKITKDGGAEIIARGICWSTSDNPAITDDKTIDGTGTGNFSSTLGNLIPNTVYYVKAYASNQAGTGYGNEVSFKTKQIEPAVLTTANIYSISQTTAISGGNITDDKGGQISSRGVCWSTKSNPTINDYRTSDGTGIGSFVSNLSELKKGTKYFVRSYAINSAGIAYGNELSFTSLSTSPEISTVIVTSVKAHTAQSGGTINSDGGEDIIAKGVCWNTDANPTIDNNKTSDGVGPENFISSILNLKAGTNYFVRAYATNGAGTAYGNSLTFTTSPDIPEITTTAVSDIGTTSARSGGNIISDEGSIVISRGVCWGTIANPTMNGLHTTDGSGKGAFTSTITGLLPNTTYYLRSYAVNIAGTGYGDEMTFTTKVGLAVLGTTGITSITTNSAVSGGTITSDGGGNITARGVCWSSAKNPTVANDRTVDGTGIGIFKSNITGLDNGTPYYVRAYATNSAGTSYGDEKSFMTLKSQIIANHTVVSDFNKIPASYMAAVKKMLVSFTGESHAVAYRDGLTLLNRLYPDYQCNIGVSERYTDRYLRVDNTGWMGEEEWFTWYAYTEGSRPAEKDIIKKIIRDYSNAGNPINVLGFSWCWDHTNGGTNGIMDPVYSVPWYGFSSGGPDGNTCWGLDAADYALTGNRVSMDTYLNATVDFVNYCKTNNYVTRIVFTTCPVDNNESEGLYSGAKGYQGHIKQEYIRSFVKADTSRILFDYADILCYDDDGKQTTTSWNGHTFPSITSSNLGDASIGHIGAAGAIRLAKAQWWLLARIAGWNGK